MSEAGVQRYRACFQSSPQNSRHRGGSVQNLREMLTAQLLLYLAFIKCVLKPLSILDQPATWIVTELHQVMVTHSNLWSDKTLSALKEKIYILSFSYPSLISGSTEQRMWNITFFFLTAVAMDEGKVYKQQNCFMHFARLYDCLSTNQRWSQIALCIKPVWSPTKYQADRIENKG